MVEGIQQPLKKSRLTAARRKEFSAKFRDWLEKAGCRINFTETGGAEFVGMARSVDIVRYDNGKPMDTICWEAFPAGMSDDDCLAFAVDRFCCGKSTVGNFKALGIEKASSLDEFELKMAVIQPID